jgi:magnesium chelatase family protein
MLVASMNPSPAGDWMNPSTASTSDMIQMQRYLSKISGPLLDRIDLHIEVRKVPYEELMSLKEGEKSDDVRERVIAARDVQLNRFMGIKGVYTNAQMDTRLVRAQCKLNPSGESILRKAMEVLGLSARAHDRILKVARTIADIEKSDQIQAAHIAEAVQYRNLDRKGWLG